MKFEKFQPLLPRLVECFLIPDRCNFATAESASTRISKTEPQNNITSGCVFKDEFRYVSGAIQHNDGYYLHELNSLFGLDKRFLKGIMCI